MSGARPGARFKSASGASIDIHIVSSQHSVGAWAPEIARLRAGEA